ncbi:muscarinic acetylcholine receptor M1-like [Amphiura filiformis]|uniref:muscarinic acetylcholine receptor M1-like n=1 Tax=Amphiura filiformis TaxID=82378 RepID=UPI003B2159D4
MDATTDVMYLSTTLNDSATSVEPGTQPPWPISVQVVLSLVVALTSLGTAIGNAIVIYAYFTTRALRTYTNFYVLNLAILDLIGGLFPMPMYGAYWIVGYWPFSIPMCDFYLWVNHTTLNATSIAVLIIAVDRYRSIVHPIKHFQQRNWRYAALWISICYIASLLIWTPAIFIWPVVSGRSVPPYICQPEYINSIGFASFAQLELFWVPVVAMAILYTKVYRVYRKRMGARKYKKKTRMDAVQASEGDSGISSKNTASTGVAASEEMSSTPGSDPGSQRDCQSGGGRFESRKMRQEGNRAVRTLSFIFAVFLASGIPWAILVVVFNMCPTCIPLALYQTSVYVARISSLFNPACYAAANPLFKNAFKRIFCFWRKG